MDSVTWLQLLKYTPRYSKILFSIFKFTFLKLILSISYTVTISFTCLLGYGIVKFTSYGDFFNIIYNATISRFKSFLH